MPRAPRLERAGAWHHVMNRGACHNNVFYDIDDRQMFLALLGEAIKRTGVEIHAFCLMHNHYHLLGYTPRPLLGPTLQYTISEYTQYFNRRHGRDGALFRGRYHSKSIANDRHLVATLRYIHRNPTNDFGIHADDYVWSSHRDYIGLAVGPNWLQTDELLRRVGGRVAYAGLMSSPLGDELAQIASPRSHSKPPGQPKD